MILSEDHRAAAGRRRRLVSRRPRERSAGPHRLRAPVRAHDVPGIEARAERLAFPACSKAPAPPASTARPTSTARTTSRRSRRTSSSWRCGSSPIAWAICSTMVDQAKLSNQQDVVRNERRQSTRTRPTASSRKRMFQALFPEGHPYHGSHHRIARRHSGGEARRRPAVLPAVLRAEQRDARDRGRYRQGRHEEARREIFRLAQARAGRFRRSRSRRRRSPPSGGSSSKIASSCRASTWRGSLRAFFKDGDAERESRAACSGRGARAASTRSSSTKSRSRRTCSAYQDSLMLGSVFGIEATARPGHTPQEIEAAIDEELDGFATEGPTAAEVERARNVLETRIVERAAARGRFRRRCRRLNLYNHYLGTPDYLAQDVMRYRNVTPDSVRRSRSSICGRTRASSSTAFRASRISRLRSPKPGEQARQPAAAESINADEPWRANAAEAGRRARLSLPVPQSFQAGQRADGASRCRTTRRAGRVGQPRRAQAAATRIRWTGPGSPASPPRMLDQGTATRNALQIADDVAQLGASLSHRTRRGCDRRSTTSSLTQEFSGGARRCWPTSRSVRASPPKRSSGCARRGSPSSSQQRSNPVSDRDKRHWRRALRLRIRTASRSSAPRLRISN